jgi:hypothetical protein
MRLRARGSRAWCDTVHHLFYRGAVRPEATRAVRRSGSANEELSVKPGREPSGGEITSENDDMSSDKEGEKPSRRKSKGSCLKLI